MKYIELDKGWIDNVESLSQSTSDASMSKCVLCGREFVTGDVHLEQGLCNECYKKTQYPDPYFDMVVDRRKLDIRENYISKLEHRVDVLEKTIELICDYIEYDYPKKDDDIWYRKSKDLELYFTNKAEEILERKNNEKDKN